MKNTSLIFFSHYSAVLTFGQLDLEKHSGK